MVAWGGATGFRVLSGLSVCAGAEGKKRGPG